jgi:subtilisin family serine protease
MKIRRSAGRAGRTVFGVLLAALLCGAVVVRATPLSSQARVRLGAGQATLVIVEFDAVATDRAAAAERVQRRLLRDEAAILEFRSQGYAATKASVTAGVAGPDAARVRDYQHFPLAVWRLSSLAALNRLEAYPGVRAVHQNSRLRAVSVSDLGFINQPQAAALGATGAGTTIAVIDGGLGTNYLNSSDFGTCTGVDVPASTCRVLFNEDLYSGAAASTETVHGTNVSAIALGVAPGANLAMFDVFSGASAAASDIIAALDTIVSDRATYNIVAVNMSLGDGTSNSAQCSGSVFASALADTNNAGIINVVAAGNSGSKTGLADPACVPGVVSVGAVYDASYGTVTWEAAGDSGGECTDATAADHVTCFSQSASYLSILGPGSFVNAPSAAFQESGTSQATPHISGSVAVLRARYPAESLAETVQRLQISGVTRYGLGEWAGDAAGESFGGGQPGDCSRGLRERTGCG